LFLDESGKASHRRIETRNLRTTASEERLYNRLKYLRNPDRQTMATTSILGILELRREADKGDNSAKCVSHDNPCDLRRSAGSNDFPGGAWTFQTMRQKADGFSFKFKSGDRHSRRVSLTYHSSAAVEPTARGIPNST
jgi:hypothetical protein